MLGKNGDYGFVEFPSMKIQKVDGGFVVHARRNQAIFRDDEIQRMREFVERWAAEVVTSKKPAAATANPIGSVGRPT